MNSCVWGYLSSLKLCAQHPSIKKFKSSSIREKISCTLVTSISSATCWSLSMVLNAIFLPACHISLQSVTLSFTRCRNTALLISLNSTIYTLVEEMHTEDNAALHAIKNWVLVPKSQLFLEKEVHWGASKPGAVFVVISWLRQYCWCCLICTT